MDLSNKTPTRLVQVSLIFSIGNFIISDFTSETFVLFILFTLTVYVSCKIYLIVCDLKDNSKTDYIAISDLQTYLQVASILFITIATFAYSYVFGAFYLFVYAIYLISPYDRDWLAGRSEIVLTDNKLEYRNK
jgi:hypothetical protein